MNLELFVKNIKNETIQIKVVEEFYKGNFRVLEKAENKHLLLNKSGYLKEKIQDIIEEDNLITFVVEPEYLYHHFYEKLPGCYDKIPTKMWSGRPE